MGEREKPRFQEWKCVICGAPVVEGQRFAWIPGKGYAHLECLLDRVREAFDGRIPGDVAALLEAEEAIAYAITRLKQARWLAVDRSIVEEIDEERRRIEGVAARNAKKLLDLLEEHGVVV